MRVPRVYAAINAVAAALSTQGIPKRRYNEPDGYAYRGIDDLYARLAPLLGEHKLCILPRVLERTATERTGTGGELLVNVAVRTAFDMVSAEDGSTHVVEAYGEALDSGDKATAKAMGSAYKYALFQALCVPTGSEDGDASSYKLARDTRATEPVQGWEQWTSDIEEMLRVCETGEAIDRVQSRQRPLLHAIARERPELYARLGSSIGAKRSALAKPKPGPGMMVPPVQLGEGGPGPGKSKAKKPPAAIMSSRIAGEKSLSPTRKARPIARKTRLNGSGARAAAGATSPEIAPNV